MNKISSYFRIRPMWALSRKCLKNIRLMLDASRIQARLLELERRHATFLRAAEYGVWELDIATDKLYLSGHFQKILGWSEDKIPATGNDYMAQIHPNDLPTITSILDAAGSNNEEAVDLEYRIRGHYGVYHWFQGKGVATRDENGKLLQLAGSMTDITARVQAETELRRHRSRLEKKVEAQIEDIKNTEARLTAAIQAIQDGFCLLDKSRHVVMINERMHKLHPSVIPPTKPGDSLEDVAATLIKSAKNDTEKTNWQQCFERLKQGVAEDEIEYADGTWLKINRAQSPSGDTIILHSDISRYKQQEAALQAQAVELQLALEKEKELNNTHRQFVFMASHEFRTPLAIIDGSIQLLCADPQNLTAERVLKRCEKIRSAVIRMTSLIDSTLTAARLDAGMVEVTPGRCDIRKLIEEVCESHQEISATHHILRNLTELPDLITADRNALERVMTNLVSNAIKYSPRNCEIFVHGWRNDDRVYITVTDHGIGIAKEDLPRMFSRFFRAQTSVGIAGTGLGLCVAQELVHLHGGEITVESHEKQGTVFTVTLPVAGTASVTENAVDAA